MSAWDMAEDHDDIPWWAKALIVTVYAALVAGAFALAFWLGG